MHRVDPSKSTSGTQPIGTQPMPARPKVSRAPRTDRFKTSPTPAPYDDATVRQAVVAMVAARLEALDAKRLPVEAQPGTLAALEQQARPDFAKLKADLQKGKAALKQDGQGGQGDHQADIPTARQLPGSGPAPLKPAPEGSDAPPPVRPRSLVAMVLDKAEGSFPRVVGNIRTGLRYLGPVAAVGSFGLNAEQLATKWSKLSAPSKALLTAGTVSSGVAAGAALVTGFGSAAAAAAALPVAIVAGGVAGTIYGGINAWKVFNNPKATAGQKGFAAMTPALSAAATVCAFIPGAQPIAIGLGIAALASGLLGNFLGKNRTVSKVFGAIGHGLATAGKAVASAGKAVIHFGSGVGHAVGSFLSHPFGL